MEELSSSLAVLGIVILCGLIRDGVEKILKKRRNSDDQNRSENRRDDVRDV